MESRLSGFAERGAAAAKASHETPKGGDFLTEQQLVKAIAGGADRLGRIDPPIHTLCVLHHCPHPVGAADGCGGADGGCIPGGLGQPGQTPGGKGKRLPGDNCPEPGVQSAAGGPGKPASGGGRVAAGGGRPGPGAGQEGDGTHGEPSAVTVGQTSAGAVCAALLLRPDLSRRLRWPWV